MAAAIAGRAEHLAPGKYQHAHFPRGDAAREVSEHAVERLLDAVETIFQHPLCQRQIGLRPAIVLETLQYSGSDVELTQNVPQSPRQFFLAFQITAEKQHGHIHHQCKTGGQPRQLLDMAAKFRRTGYRDQARAGQAQPRRSGSVGKHETQVIPQCEIEFSARFHRILGAGRRDFLEHVRMAADRTLAEDHHAAGEDVGAFDGYTDRNLLVGAAQIVIGTKTDALAAVHVHGIVDDLAAALGTVILDDRRYDRGLLAQVHRARGHGARRIDRVGIAADARQRFFDALEFANRYPELAAHAAVCSRGARCQFCRAGARGRQ